ncbi:transcription factor IIIB 50 kDa subunit [Bombina bombina]|uniref:transcription factor IIIB 50 kDa subunit n=1 Tax=Bombina bombina TaxID=8345 RepID=UPI00235AC043|nr:transcription factor IIIB 50 kDa subunit [Bombina bombina]
MSMQKCPDCGSSEIVEDAHYAQDQMVCADCGYVLTEGLLTTTQNEEVYMQAVRFSESTGENASMSKSLLIGLKRVRDLCKVLRLPLGCEDTAVSYYERAFVHPTYHFVTLQKKAAVMGCCVYITCRQHGWPLTMATICSLMYVNKELFSGIFRDLIQDLKLDVPALSLQDMVRNHCKSFRLFDDFPYTPPGFAENLDKVIERTLQVVELASDTWLVTGRQPIPIITAAAYLSWRSLNPSCRMSCSINQFCKLSETELPPPAKKRKKEIEDNLLKLAIHLPWLKVLSVNKKNVVQHLGDILKHRVYLLRQTLTAAEKSATETKTLTMDTEESTTSTGTPSPAHQHKETPVMPFLPPCLTEKRKYVKAFSKGPQDITGDEDISDSEIEQYLRTQAEVDTFLQVKDAMVKPQKIPKL